MFFPCIGTEDNLGSSGRMDVRLQAAKWRGRAHGFPADVMCRATYVT